MQRINGGSSRELNKTDKVNRAIWGQYYNINTLNKDSYYRIIGYILGNPLKHKLVKNINDLKNYKFCNYNEIVKKSGKESINEIIQNVVNLNWKVH